MEIIVFGIQNHNGGNAQLENIDVVVGENTNNGTNYLSVEYLLRRTRFPALATYTKLLESVADPVISHFSSFCL